MPATDLTPAVRRRKAYRARLNAEVAAELLDHLGRFLEATTDSPAALDALDELVTIHVTYRGLPAQSPRKRGDND